MKKFTLLLVVVFMAGAVFSQTDAKSSKLSKKDVSTFINETNDIISQTSALVSKNKVYTGGVVKAIEVQKKAIELFKTGNLQKAMNESSKARGFGFVTYEANTDKAIPSAWRTTKAEQNMITVTMSKTQLNSSLTKELINKEKVANNINTSTLNDVK